MFALRPIQPRLACLMRIGEVILFGCVALVALANVYLGFPDNPFAPMCNGQSSSPCLGCSCLPAPSWKPPVVTFLQTYPFLSATLLVASLFIAVVGVVIARRGQRSLNPIFLLLPVIAMMLISLAALLLYVFEQRL